MSQYQSLFGIKCETMESFLECYSNSKKCLHNLKKGKSIAVTDDTFLRAYCTIRIEAAELQHEMKKVLKDLKYSYANILENIHSDFCAQETGELMRDNPTSSSSTTLSIHRSTPDENLRSIKDNSKNARSVIT